jgi:membrane protein YqaA with SNARE-associated domain
MKYGIIASLAGAGLAVTLVGLWLLADTIEPHLGALQKFGYLGVFAAALVTNAFLFVPVPIGLSLAMVVAAQNDSVSVAVVYAAGAAIGESVSYFLGAAGKKMIKVSLHSQRAESWFRRGGKGRFWKRNGAMTLLALTPFPPFDFIGILAGALRYPFWEFLTFCFIGRVVKYIIVLSILSGYVPWRDVL